MNGGFDLVQSVCSETAIELLLEKIGHRAGWRDRRPFQSFGVFLHFEIVRGDLPMTKILKGFLLIYREH